MQASMWMDRILQRLDIIMNNVSNSGSLQVECDVLILLFRLDDVRARAVFGEGALLGSVGAFDDADPRHMCVISCCVISILYNGSEFNDRPHRCSRGIFSGRCEWCYRPRQS